jgi:malonate decarboxylase gamma subunit
MDEESMIGRGREAIDMIFDSGSLQENVIGDFKINSETGPGAVVGTVMMNGEQATVIANDAEEYNPRFPVVFAGVIGLEEGYKMAQAVYFSLESDRNKPVGQKRPIVLIVDTPGNGPGKVEEIFGMNKSTGAYQLALAEARKAGHPIVAIVIGRAISGAFLCHGLQADHILSLSKEFGTMIHVMPLTSISRITKLDIEILEELSLENPVFAAGVNFFHRLGGVNEVVETLDGMKEAVARHIKEVRQLKADGQFEKLGPWGRGGLGAERGGRKTRVKVMAQMKQEFDAVADKYLNA